MGSSSSPQRVLIPSRIYFRIGDVAEILGVKPYVIRFWETEFPFVAPDKAVSGQRVYRRPQIEGLVLIKHLLHIERYSIEGAKKKLTELRKHAKLKEAMLELVRGEDSAEELNEPIRETSMTQSETVNHLEEAVAAAPLTTQIGSKVDKDSIASLADSLSASVRDLQTMIRDPKLSGLSVPSLPENAFKTKHSN